MDHDPNPDNLKPGDTVTRSAVNGHLMDYTVRVIDPEGYPVLSQWDASHSDSCPCLDTPEPEPHPGW